MTPRASDLLSVPVAYKKPQGLSDVFEHEPVGLTTFIKDKKFLGADWMLSPLQMELVMVGERVFKQSLYPLMAEEFGGYWKEVENIPMRNSIVAQWGKGGGKDSTVRVISARVAHLLLCLKSPQEYFGMPPDDTISLLNIAVNAAQAQRAFFNPLSRMVTRGWMNDYSEPHRDSITYAKNIEAISGHSDAESQEGLNILLGVADEIDAFKAKGEMIGQGNKAREASTSAESILEMLESSAVSRFDETYKRIAISYPRYKGSTIQQLTLEAREDMRINGDDSMFFASGPWATWDVNPMKTKDSFKKQYRKNPDEAAAKYECKPTRATDAYFRNPVIFTQAVDAPKQPIDVDYHAVTFRSKETGNTVRGWEPIFTFAPDFKPVAGARYALHGDLAISGDRAGIAMSHVVSWVDTVDLVTSEDGSFVEVPTTAPIIRNDFTISFRSDIGATDPLNPEEKLPREIQIRWVRTLAFELIKKGFYIGSFTFDGFQSKDVSQILLMHGIESTKVSTDVDPSIWKTVKDVASDARLMMPYSQLLQHELEGLSRLERGKVDHPPGGSKDEADAFACSIVGAIELGGGEDPEGTEIEVLGEGLVELTETFAPLIGTDMFVGMSGGLSLPIGMKEAMGSGNLY